MSQTINKNSRIDVVDALRGFAIMGILLVHSLEHFIFPVYPVNSPQWLQIIDEGVLNIIFTLFAGKAYAIFAILFGFTFYIQHNNQKRRGGDFGYRFLWRLVLLIAFATLNAAFFPAGDVLLLFVAVGPILFITRNWSNKAILITSIIFLLQPVEWYHYFASLGNPLHQLPDLKVGEMYAEVAEYTKAGSAKEFFLGNITLGQKASLFWAINAGRFFQTIGLFLLGFYFGRKQFFVSSKQNYKFWIKVLIISAILFAPLYTLKEQVMTNEKMVQQTVGTILDMWQKLAFTLVLVSSFNLLYNTPRFRKMVNNLRYYGKMSLTNYVAQSIIGALIYFPIGLYLAPYCGYTISLLIGVAILIAQIYASKWWLSKHKRGPLEQIWHRWTWIGTDR